MPTYTVSAPAGRLNDQQKARIARDITREHREKTGAQSFFAQVLFMEIDPKNWFMGGVPATEGQIFIHGQIRAGRSADVKRALLESLLRVVSAAADYPMNRMWGYIHELPPAHMAEYGHILPEPGTEAQWLEGLPAADRSMMQSIGT